MYYCVYKEKFLFLFMYLYCIPTKAILVLYKYEKCVLLCILKIELLN